MQIFIQCLMPHKLLSFLAHYIANCKIKFIKNLLIKFIIKIYDIDLTKAEITDINKFSSFNDFFIRKFNKESINICQGKDEIASPVEGCISQFGKINNSSIIQAKNINYDVHSLLGYQKISQNFIDGNFITIYLAPHNYHRIHMPLSGTLEEMIYVPGRLYAVKQELVRNLPGLFTRNERVAGIFNTNIGKVAVILVGAMIVGSIETTWHGVVTPPHHKKISTWKYSSNNEKAISIKKGDEMGLFKMGSTVILLFEKNKISWEQNLKINQNLNLGDFIANIC